MGVTVSVSVANMANASSCTQPVAKLANINCAALSWKLYLQVGDAANASAFAFECKRESENRR